VYVNIGVDVTGHHLSLYHMVSQSVQFFVFHATAFWLCVTNIAIVVVILLFPEKLKTEKFKILITSSDWWGSAMEVTEQGNREKISYGTWTCFRERKNNEMNILTVEEGGNRCVKQGTNKEKLWELPPAGGCHLSTKGRMHCTWHPLTFYSYLNDRALESSSKTKVEQAICQSFYFFAKCEFWS